MNFIDIRINGYSLPEDIAIVKRAYPVLQVRAQAETGMTLEVLIQGMRGGHNPDRRLDAVDYLVQIILAQYPRECPQAFVIAPHLEHIQHLNVYPNGKVCISVGERFERDWRSGNQLPPGVMSITGFLVQVNFILKAENPESRAR